MKEIDIGIICLLKMIMRVVVVVGLLGLFFDSLRLAASAILIVCAIATIAVVVSLMMENYRHD